MSHLKLSCRIPAQDVERTEAALLAAGAQSLGYFDAAHDPILEPLPGHTPLWPRVRIEALFPQDADRAHIEALLRDGAEEQLDVEFSRLEDRVWEREWLRDFKCTRFGERLWVCPDGQRPSAPDAVVLDLDPGLAFGTGSHPTTAMCLEWLDAADLGGRTVVDYGCGSGVLAIAALQLGAARAIAVDIDAQALTATRANARRNRVEDRLVIADAGGIGRTVCDVLLANILAGPLTELSGPFAAAIKPGGLLVMSGILEEQASQVADAYAPWFDVVTRAARDGWSCIVVRRDGCVANREG
jgi:ribosomal protein L11 methyltransferase